MSTRNDLFKTITDPEILERIKQLDARLDRLDAQQCKLKRKHNKELEKLDKKRGIVLKKWICSFENFLKDMGERPADLSLDRKNKMNHHITYHGDTTICSKCKQEWDTNDPDPPMCFISFRTIEDLLQALCDLKLVKDVHVTGGYWPPPNIINSVHLTDKKTNTTYTIIPK